MVLGDPILMASPELSYFIFFALPLGIMGWFLWWRMNLILDYSRVTLRESRSHFIIVTRALGGLLACANQKEPQRYKGCPDTLTDSDSLTEDEQSDK